MTYRHDLHELATHGLRSQDSEGRPSPRGEGAARTKFGRPDPEVPAKKQRRRFTAKYKKRILEEAEACTEPGQIGALLRREGLYSSYLNTWRRQRGQGTLYQLASKRGRKKKPVDPEQKRIKDLEKENAKLKDELKKAETIIEFQKKISEILGIAQDQKGKNGQNS